MATTTPTELHIGKPNNFDGDKAYARRFLSSCETYLDLNDKIYNSDKKKIIFALSFMLDKAAGDWATNRTTVALAKDPATQTAPGFGTWDDFVNDFRNTFITTDDNADARRQLLDLKQTGTADDYNNQFRSLVTRSGITDQNALSEMYQRGLTRGLLTKIYNRDKLPEKMEDWYKAASQADNLFRRLQTITGNTNTQSTTPRTNRFRNFMSSSPTTSPTTSPTSSITRPKKLTPEEREKCLKEGRCLACREKGHNARECTKFPRTFPTSNIRQVAPETTQTPVATPPAPPPALPTKAEDIMAQIRALLVNAGEKVAEDVLTQLDCADFQSGDSERR